MQRFSHEQHNKNANGIHIDAYGLRNLPPNRLWSFSRSLVSFYSFRSLLLAWFAVYYLRVYVLIIILFFSLFIPPCVFVATTFSLHQWNDMSYVRLSAYCCCFTKTKAIHSSLSLHYSLAYIFPAVAIFLWIISISSLYEIAGVLCIVCFVGLALLIFYLSFFFSANN